MQPRQKSRMSKAGEVLSGGHTLSGILDLYGTHRKKQLARSSQAVRVLQLLPDEPKKTDSRASVHNPMVARKPQEHAVTHDNRIVADGRNLPERPHAQNPIHREVPTWRQYMNYETSLVLWVASSPNQQAVDFGDPSMEPASLPSTGHACYDCGGNHHLRWTAAIRTSDNGGSGPWRISLLTVELP